MRAETRPSPALTRSPLAAPGSLSVLALFGLAASAVPLPFLPSAVLRRVRGALVHDVATRHGLSLTDEGRHEMSELSRRAQGGAILTTVAFVARRTLRSIGLLGLVPPFATGLEVYALGLLFDRYLERVRSSKTLRIHGAEARLVRHAIDAAVSRAFSPSLEPRRRLGQTEPTEELRPLPTRIFDGVLLGLAGVPDYVRRRLETAFDLQLEKDSFHV
jgi:hypothetical protein